MSDHFAEQWEKLAKERHARIVALEHENAVLKSDLAAAQADQRRYQFLRDHEMRETHKCNGIIFENHRIAALAYCEPGKWIGWGAWIDDVMAKSESMTGKEKSND